MRISLSLGGSPSPPSWWMAQRMRRRRGRKGRAGARGRQKRRAPAGGRWGQVRQGGCLGNSPAAGEEEERGTMIRGRNGKAGARGWRKRRRSKTRAGGRWGQVRTACVWCGLTGARHVGVMCAKGMEGFWGRCVCYGWGKKETAAATALRTYCSVHHIYGENGILALPTLAVYWRRLLEVQAFVVNCIHSFSGCIRADFLLASHAPI